MLLGSLAKLVCNASADPTKLGMQVAGILGGSYAGSTGGTGREGARPRGGACAAHSPQARRGALPPGTLAGPALRSLLTTLAR
eukprot:8336059-Pyramimonas_sp.AAC.3